LAGRISNDSAEPVGGFELSGWETEHLELGALEQENRPDGVRGIFLKFAKKRLPPLYDHRTPGQGRLASPSFVHSPIDDRNSLPGHPHPWPWLLGWLGLTSKGEPLGPKKALKRLSPSEMLGGEVHSGISASRNDKINGK